MKQTILTRESSTVEIRRYFMAVLKLSKSDQEFPVNLDEVYPLVYNKRSDAVDVLQKTFMQDIDYQVLRQNPQNPKGGRPKIEYRLSVPCMEFFIARKIRPVFEVYRKVFHTTVAKNASIPLESKKIQELKKDISMLDNRLKWAKITSQQETDLKNSCFFYLVGKGLYTEWHEWNQERITKRITEEIKRSLNI